MKKILLLLFFIKITITALGQVGGTTVIIKGVVFNLDTVPLSGAVVSAEYVGDSLIYDTTDQNGNYLFIVKKPPLNHQLIATKEGYISDTANVSISGDTTLHDFYLNKKMKIVTLAGIITLDAGDNIQDVITTLIDSVSGDIIEKTHPDNDGYYLFDSVTEGIYIITAELDDYYSIPNNYHINTDSLNDGEMVNTLNFLLKPGSADLYGVVTNKYNALISGALIYIDDVLEDTTNDNGEFYVEGLSLTQHSLHVLAQDFLSKDTSFFLSTSEDTINVKLDYKPKLFIEDTLSQLSFISIVNQFSESKSFYVKGTQLQSEVVVHCPDNYEISKDTINFKNEDIEFPAADTIKEKVYIRFSPNISGELNDIVNISSQFAVPVVLNVKGVAYDVLNVNIFTPDDTVCPGTMVEINSEVTGGTGKYIYNWLKNGNPLSNEPSIRDAVNEETTYTLEVTDSSFSALLKDTSIVIYTFVDNTVILTDPKDDSVCLGDPVSFTIKLNVEAGVSYQWQRKEEGNNDWINLNDNDVYSGCKTNYLRINKTDILLDSNEFRCGYFRICDCFKKYSKSATLTVFPLPIDTIIRKGTNKTDIPIVLISPDSGQRYQWYINDSVITGATGQYYYPGLDGFKPGTYYVKITNKYGCSINTHPVKIKSTKAVNIKVYPNPSTNKLYINIQNIRYEENYSVTIRNLRGVPLIYTTFHAADNNTFIIPVDKLKTGSYLIEVRDKYKSKLYSDIIIIN